MAEWTVGMGHDLYAKRSYLNLGSIVCLLCDLGEAT